MMTGFLITTEQDEAMFTLYVQMRDAVRAAMGFGVYPNLKAALAAYAALDVALAEGGALYDGDLIAYHSDLIAGIAPYVAQLRAAASGIVETMTEIELAAPGTFGIVVEEQNVV